MMLGRLAIAHGRARLREFCARGTKGEMDAQKTWAAALLTCLLASGCDSQEAPSGGAGGDASTRDGSMGSEDATSPDASDESAADPNDSASDSPRPADSYSEDATTIDATDDAPAADAAHLDVAVGDGGACNALANTAPSVPETQVAGDPPTPAGGTFVPGLYYLTRWQVFTGNGGASGPTGNTRTHAINFHSTTYDEVLADNGGMDQRSVRTWSFSGTFLDSMQLCPTMEDLGDDYTATPTTLILQASGLVFTLTKQ